MSENIRDAVEALDTLFGAAIDDQGWLWLDVAQHEYERVRRALESHNQERGCD